MKKKSCKTCGWKFDNGRELPILHKDNEEDVRLANEYCKEHTFIYGHECEPIWCEKCGHLDMYLATVSENSKEPKFDKRK
jgi:predicted Zn-ribbon and HTH transcriptional regulator